MCCPSAAVINSIASCTGYLNKNIVVNLQLLQMKVGHVLLFIIKDFGIFLSWSQAMASKTDEEYAPSLSLLFSLTWTLWLPLSSQV